MKIPLTIIHSYRSRQAIAWGTFQSKHKPQLNPELLCEMETSYEVLGENLHLKQCKGASRVYYYLLSVDRFKEI